MIINENSWHFKIYAAFNSTWNRPKTLCAYFWKTLIPVLAASIIGFAILAAVTIIGQEILTKFFVLLIQYLQNRTGINVIEQAKEKYMQNALIQRVSRSFPLQADDKNSFTWKEKKGTFLYQSSHTRSLVESILLLTYIPS